MSRTFVQVSSGGPFVPPMYESPAARAADTPVIGEIVLDPALGCLILGDGKTQGGKFLTPAAAFAPGVPFSAQGTLTAAAAGTAVILIPDGIIPAGAKIFVTSWFVSVSGATAWTDATATIVKIQDNAAAAILTFAKAGLTANAMLVPGSGNTTLAAALTAQSGLTAGRGLQVVADANFAAGSDLKVFVRGYIK